jgi:glutathione S-transferase
MILYDSQVSGNCYKVRLLCAQLGLPLERRELSVIDRSNRMETIGHLNPALRVPTLVLEDGRALAESNAILNYLAEGSAYMPQDRYERAKVQQWEFFEQYEIEPNLAVARFWQIAGIDPGEEQRGLKTTAGTRALEALERGLSGREWLVADRYTVADIALYAYTHVAPEGGFALEAYPAVREWQARVAAQPGHILITE